MVFYFRDFPIPLTIRITNPELENTEVLNHRERTGSCEVAIIPESEDSIQFIRQSIIQ